MFIGSGYEVLCPTHILHVGRSITTGRLHGNVLILVKVDASVDVGEQLPVDISHRNAQFCLKKNEKTSKMTTEIWLFGELCNLVFQCV